MITSNRLFALFVLFAIPFVVSCQDDEDPKGGASSKGTWTAKMNGVAWIAGKIQKSVHNDNTTFNAYRDSDKSVITMAFTDIHEGTYVIGQTEGGSAASYGDVNSSATLEDATEGEIVITKFTTDSLVATFNFKSATREFTEGRIRIKHN